MDKTFTEVVSGIRHAEYGVEVREDIAQGMEYVESFARTAVSASAAASASEANAENSYQNAKAQAELSAQHEQAAKDQVTYATEQAAAAATSATASENSNVASGQKAEQADSFQKMAAKYLQSTKEYFEQVRTITIGAQGWYATPEALKAAVPVGENGWWAVVGTTDTIWTWDSDTNTWKDSVQKADLSDYLTQDQVKKLLEQYMPLRPATAAVLGGVKLSDDFTADADGTLHLADGTAPEPYPVGSIYQSTDPTSPASLFGGTWEQVASERVLMGASSTHAAGTTAEAGLPNITGQVPAAKQWQNGNTWVISGSFAWTNTRPNGNYNSSISSGDDVSSLAFYQADFNASRSNGIYGRSSTVQPAAYYVYIWHRVA